MLAMTAPNKFPTKSDRIADLERKLAEAKAQIEAMKRGEFICVKCGLRKDDEHEKGEF